jgi:hypothetical protein
VRRPPGDAGGPLGGKGRVICMRDIFILNGILAQDRKKYFCRSYVWLKYFTYHLVPLLALNYTQHILSAAKVIKLRY